MGQTADLILTGNVFPCDGRPPFRGGVAVAGNRILAVGDGAEMARLTGDATTLRDCGDGLILPGFVDAHMHLFIGAIASSEHMTTDIAASTSEEDCLRIIGDYYRSHPQEVRIRAQGWALNCWDRQVLPTLQSLDAVIPDKPAYLLSSDGHTCWTNTAGLRELGFDEHTKLTVGTIGLDEHGRPNGILSEVGRPIFDMMYTLPVDQMKDAERDFFRGLARWGVTTISDMDTTAPTAAMRGKFEATRELESEGKLTARVNFYLDLTSGPDYGAARQWREDFCTPLMKIKGLKQLVDGVTSTWTGLLLDPYDDRPEETVEPLFPTEQMQEWVNAANRDGFDVRLHCIGDGAVRVALDLFEESRRVNGYGGEIRNSVEHIETIHPDDIPRFQALNVIASMQPEHLPLDANEKLDRCGIPRCRYEWPHRSLLEQGAVLAYGTDYPVVDYNPFPGICASVTRCDAQGRPTGVNPQETLSLEDTLTAYTAGAAYAYGMEDEIGTLSPGKLADIAVTDRNLFAIPPLELRACTVKLTVMDGKIVHDAESVTACKAQ